MSARAATPGAAAALCVGLLLALLGGSPAAAQEAPSVRERVADYDAARARAGDFLLSPREVVERLLAGRKMTLLDIRGRGAYAAAHLRGARSLPFKELLRAIRTERVPGRSAVVVVDEGDNQAVEAMVALRLTGWQAFAMTGGMGALRRLLAEPPQAPGSAIADDPARARALLVGTQAEVALERPGLLRGRFLPWLAAALLLAAAVLYARARLARRRRRPLREAFEVLEQNRVLSFEAAEARLQRALGGRLSRREAAEASFALAYVRTRLGELQRASDGLDQLIAAGHRHPTVLYLDLWVKVRRGDEAAAARYEQSADALGHILHSRSLASIAFLRLARRAVARRKVDDALKYFKEVRNLAVLADRVPEGLEDLPVAVGVEALLEGQVADAADRFERAGDGAEQGSGRALAARLGSLLCRWRQRDGRLPIGFEEELAAVVDEVRAGLQGADPDDRGLQERRRLHRDLLLWQAMARLAGWQGRWVGRGVPADERERLGELLDELRRVDADMADPYLLEGLVGYAFGAPGPEHDRAVEALQQASDRGVSLPEVLTILEREQVRSGRAAGRVEEWLDAVRGYLSDPRTPEELRRRLQRQVAGLTRHTPLLREDLELAQFQVVPTLGDLHNRSQLLQRRVRRLFPPAAHGAGRDGAPDADRLLEPLEQATQLLGAAAQAFTTAELELLVLVGGLLLAGETIRD